MQKEDIAEYLLKQRLELTGYVRAVARDRCLAEDIFQDVCVRAVRDSERFSDHEHLAKWFRRVARHRAIDHYRKQKQSHLLLDEAVLEKLEAEADSAASATREYPAMHALAACMETLTPRSRKLVAMRYGEEMSGIEVAHTLNRKVDTIYKALARIYAHLRDCIRGRLGGSPAPSTPTTS